MVGVPRLGDEVRFRPVGADRLTLALPQPQMIDDPGAEQEHEHQRRDHRAAGAHGEIAEHVENRERAGKIGQPVKHRINPERTPLRARVATELAGERLDDRAHPRAERALDHHRVARVHRAEHVGFERRGCLGIAAPAFGGKGLPQRFRSAGRRRTRDRPHCPRSPRPGRDAAPRLRPEFQHVAQHGDAPAARPDRRLAEQRQRRPHRGRIGVVALVDQQRRRRRAVRASMRSPRPPLGGLNRQAPAPRARDRRRPASPPPAPPANCTPHGGPARRACR